ncbi:hypothetical protein CCR75_004937 [Bremia lactucae]|uniref:Peptidase A2 domain-containing protein n=1 Tax=Bremia lactucae TaxID=4779 RepID=A0A976ID57_BRELC|nr:hypothetical protein CCR75_004937 [Bremia lactucae]
MAYHLKIERRPGKVHPGKNDLVDTDCKVVKKCSKDKSVCSQVCERGSVVVPDWLQSTLAYRRNLALKKPFCLAQIPATHNSAITLADGFENRDQLFYQNVDPRKTWSCLKTNNQVLSLTDQLILSVRFLEIDTHFFLNDLRTGHCGSLNSTVLTELSDALVSGIKSSEQPLTKDGLKEAKVWIDANPNEFVVVYLDTGADIERLN